MNGNTNDRPLLTLHLRLAMLNVRYFRNPPRRYGTRLTVGSRNWLQPGAYLWSLSVKRNDPATYRKWRSVWRRPIPRLNGPPVYSAWHKRPRRTR